MNKIEVRTTTEEIQYRLKRLKAIEPLLRDKKIAVYGTGINAKRVLDCLNTLAIVGLMDYNSVGEFYFEKKVLSEEELQLLRVDTILIAAEPESTQIVYERIMIFCLQNNITILNMYGCDEMKLHRFIKEQELNYAALTAEFLQQKIKNSKTIFFSFQQVLCTQTLGMEEIIEIVEKKIKKNGIKITNFKRNRLLAQKRIPFGMKYNIKDIYTILSVMVDIDEKCITEISGIEKEVMLEYLLPRKSMIELLKYAQDCNCCIYICSNVLGGEEIVRNVLLKYGISDCNVITRDSGALDALIGRTIHAVCEEVGKEKVLYIGSNQNNELIIPQLYGADIQLIEDSMTMFWNYSHFNSSRTVLEQKEDFCKISEIVQKEYNSPFLTEIEVDRCTEQISKIIGWNEEENAGNNLDLIPLMKWNKEEEIEKLFFEETTDPMVSIIIPAHNQFEYTYNCLKAILLNSGAVKYEIILADDCSTDWTKNIEKFVEGIQVIHNAENLLFLINCNKASHYANGKYLLFLNNDTQVQLNWLSPLIKIFEQDKDAGMVGSKLIFPDGKLQEAGGIIWNNANGWNYGREKNPYSPEFNYVREVDYISGASIMLPKALWEQIGGFDERYAPAYYEDADLAFEVRKKGKKVIYQPDSEVIHFEGVSNGTNIGVGIKRYQVENKNKFFDKWKEILLKEQCPAGENVLSACDRKGKRKTVLFISESIPTYDKDAGSRSIDFYILEFIRREYLVKFIPDCFVAEEPYAHRLQQMGVEVIAGTYFKRNVLKWIYKYHAEIDYAFLNYPNASFKYIDVLSGLNIPVRYYGVDLHYLRSRREYELFGVEDKLKESRLFYDKEAYLIEKCEVAYYPSLVETEIVKIEFHKNKVRQLLINMYDVDDMKNNYEPIEREGILFIGGYRHAPNVDAVLWFAYEIFPRIYNKLKVPFYVAGVGMPTEIQNIKVPGIVILGALTERELENIYKKVKMVVAPLRYGAGIKGKIIEAIYNNIPVVTTTIGAEGIPNEDNAITIADDEAEFSDKVCKIYCDNQMLKQISKTYGTLIAKYFSREAAWNNICEDFR